MFRLLLIALFLIAPLASAKETSQTPSGHIAIVEMDMIILPGTLAYLDNVIRDAKADGARAIVVKLDTPGGMLDSSQKMIQSIFQSEIPVIIYVTPSGATATSAGVFITMAGHIAAMSPGTSIGAAHPVAGDGQDIEGDMRKKAENMTIAMVKAISKERGRNVEWAEKSVKESDSITAEEALKNNVIDLIAPNIQELLKSVAGKKVKIKDQEVKLSDYSQIPLKVYEIDFRNKALNFISHPNIAALLWLGATTGLSLELYNPGAILPGVVGLICLVLALAVMQIIPITQTGIILFVLGAAMLMAEMYMGTGILAIGGIISLVLGAIYLIDPTAAPGMAVDPEVIIPAALVAGLFMLWVLRVVVKAQKSNPTTGAKGMAGMIASAEEGFAEHGKVFVNGEIWNANLVEGDPNLVKKGDNLEVISVKDNLELEVKIKGE